MIFETDGTPYALGYKCGGMVCVLQLTLMNYVVTQIVTVSGTHCNTPYDGGGLVQEEPRIMVRKIMLMKCIGAAFLRPDALLHDLNHIIIIYIFKVQYPMDCTQNGCMTLKQYDHYQILNELVHITLLHNINICAE